MVETEWRGAIFGAIGLILLSIGLPPSLDLNLHAVLNGIAWIVLAFHYLGNTEDKQ